MKKILTVSLLIIAFFYNGKAQDYVVVAPDADINQEDSRDLFHFGVKAGANLSNIYDSEGEEWDAKGKIGFAGGVFMSVPLGRYLGIQPEVLFSQKGFRSTGELLGTSYDLTRTTDFIDIPIFLSIKPSEGLSILAGPQFSFLLNEKDEFSNGNLTGVQQREFKNDNIRKNVLCAVGGIDLNLGALVIGARAGMDIQNNNGDGTSTMPRYKNGWYQATLGFRF